MSLPFKRALAVGTTAALAFLSLFILPAHSFPSTTPTSCAGVWVVVQSDETLSSSAKIGCATEHTTGIKALESAGFSTVLDSGFVLQVEGLPVNTDWGSNGHLSWGYLHAVVDANGTISGWTEYLVGAGSTSPAAGTVEGWILTKNYPYPHPGVDSVPAATASASVSSAPASASESVSVPASSAASTTSASTSASASSKSPIKNRAVAAANFINGNLPMADDGASALMNAAYGLTAVDSCTYAPTIRKLVADLKTQAKDFTAGNPGRAALLAVFASAMGEDPTSFGGVDLLGSIDADIATRDNGQVGAYPSSFVQSFAVIAYVRAGKDVPAAVLKNLLDSQDKSGAFGYVSGDVFSADYDSTGLAIQALHAAGKDSAATAAAKWATSAQNDEGYWELTYSPVDSTGILGSALKLVGTGTGGALGWIESQQLPDGGFPATVPGTDSNLLATVDALWLITGTSYVTVTFQASGCTSTVASPGATADELSSLADTGASDGTLQVTLVGCLVLITGLALVASRPRVRLP